MSFLDTGYSEDAAATPAFELLPPGDYKFRVSECLGITFTDNGHEKVSLIILINSKRVYTYLYAGTSSKGEPFDMISPFCRAIGIRPTSADAKNTRYWSELVGKQGMCHLVQEEQQGGKYAGQPQNKVKYFIYPKDVGTAQRAPRSAPPLQHAVAVTRPHDPDLDVEPDDIPFRSTVYKDVRKHKLNRRVF